MTSSAALAKLRDRTGQYPVRPFNFGMSFADDWKGKSVEPALKPGQICFADIPYMHKSWGEINGFFDYLGYKRPVSPGNKTVDDWYGTSGKLFWFTPTEEEVRRYVSYLVNESPYAAAYLTKDVDQILTEGTQYDVELPGPYIIGGAILLRMIVEYQALPFTWNKLIERGVDPEFALVMMHLFMPRQTAEGSWRFWSEASGNHWTIHIDNGKGYRDSYAMTAEGFKWFKKGRQNPKHKLNPHNKRPWMPFRESPVYRGLNAYWDKGGPWKFEPDVIEQTEIKGRYGSHKEWRVSVDEMAQQCLNWQKEVL